MSLSGKWLNISSNYRTIKKTKSADHTRWSETDYKGITVNVHDNDPDYPSDDEERKIRDDISDEDLDLTFDINDDDFDLFGTHSETIYSKYNENTEVKAKDFTLKKLLRETDTGKVYLAQHNGTKECYALKSIKKDLFVKNMKSLSIQKELNKQVHHPFIMSFEYVLQNEYRIYFVSELLKGGDLDALIRKKGALKEEQVRFYAAQLVIVLGYLHEQDIVYRNLKTSNVLINSDGYIKIGDFDCCSKLPKDSLSQSFLNLKEYQAPEILDGRGHDQTIDWWALGVVMSQMLFDDVVFYYPTLGSDILMKS